jgi:hypothetical protein
VEARMTRDRNKFRFTIYDNGHTVASTLGDSPKEARSRMREQLDRIHRQGLELAAEEM